MAGQNRSLQLDQILANLCVNARDAITDIGKMTIETDTVSFDQITVMTIRVLSLGIIVMLAVSDNGCGMDKRSSRIFLNRSLRPNVGERHRPWVGNGLRYREAKQRFYQRLQ